MAKLGIGPSGNYDPAKFSPEILSAINNGIAEGHKQIVDGAAAAVESSQLYGTREFMGTRYLDRAVGVEAGGIIPNVPKQAFYGQWTKDARGEVYGWFESQIRFHVSQRTASHGSLLLEPDYVRSQDAPAGR